MNFKSPILAASLLPPSVEHTDENIFAAMKKLKYPVGATLKKDGIRALRLNGTLLSRRFKKIPNKSIRDKSVVFPGGLDFELWNKDLQYHEIESIVMSHEHVNSHMIEYHILDYAGASMSYANRCRDIMQNMAAWSEQGARFSPPVICENAEQLFAFEKACIEELGEGICFRTLNSPYKQGRSTLKEQYLVKLARYTYEECTIIGFNEQFLNTNPAVTNRLGLTERGHSQWGMVGKGTLGAFVVKLGDITFPVGSGHGMTDKFRQEVWNNKEKYLGKIIRVKCKSHGAKVKPRSPTFAGFRNVEID